MILTWSQYENMGKEELVQELTINSSFVNNINAKRSDLPDRFNKIMSKYDKAYSKSNVKATLQLSSTYQDNSVGA